VRLIDADLLKQNCKITGEFDNHFQCVDLITLGQVIDNQPTISETEIIHNAFERVLERLEELKEDCDCYGYLTKKGTADLAIKIIKEECGIGE
jgi:single-stranded DNA-specific DHH superfamily exonuclease